MCGRFTLTDPARAARRFVQFRFEEFSEYRLPRFNIAPSQLVFGVRSGGSETVEGMHWGSDGRINARAETINGAPAPQRCIIFADGFYEWSAGRPYYFTLQDDEPFAFAGLWQAAEGAPVCSIITCQANELAGAVHHRMPVILPDSILAAWLSPQELPIERQRSLLIPFDAAAMRSRPVSTRLNDARYDAPDILTHADPVQTSLF